MKKFKIVGAILAVAVLGGLVGGVLFLKPRPVQIKEKKESKRDRAETSPEKRSQKGEKEEEKISLENKGDKKVPSENQSTLEFFFSADGLIYKYKDGQVAKVFPGDHPRYSKEGNNLLFSRDIDGDGLGDEIWIKDLDTNQERGVTKGSVADWAARENEIVVNRSAQERSLLVKRNLTTGKEVVIAEDIGGINGIDYSSRGGILLDISGGESEPEIDLVDLDGSNFRKLINGWSPHWSSDGSKIIYSQNSPDVPYNISIYIYQLQTGKTSEVTPDEKRNLHSPRFLEDGEKVLFSRQQIGKFEISLLDLKTKEAKVLHTLASGVRDISVK